jgi:hypothetical protein
MAIFSKPVTPDDFLKATSVVEKVMKNNMTPEEYKTLVCDVRCRANDVYIINWAVFYVLNVHYNYTSTAIGRYTGRDRTAIAHAINRLFDRQDSEPRIDNLLNKLD